MAFVLLSRLHWLLLILLHFFFFSPFQLISSKVPKAEYVPTIIRRDDPSIIPILYVSISLLLCLNVWEQASYREIFFFFFLSPVPVIPFLLW